MLDTLSVASINGVAVTELFYDDDNHTLSLSGLNCRLEHEFGCDGFDLQKLTLKVTPV